MITSDTRTPENDETGKIAMNLLKGEHKISSYVIVKNDIKQIHETFMTFLNDIGIQVIITSGGTGISSKDKTVDEISSHFEKELPGFGELFRMHSYNEIGEAAMYSRATAGTVGGKIVFCLPGSKGAMEMALTRLILPGLGHMLWEVSR
jgi:molybdenum cofactor biosynthesis protein B